MEELSFKVKCVHSDQKNIKQGKDYSVFLNDENELLIEDEIGYGFIIGEVINEDVSLFPYYEVTFKITK